MDNGLCDHECTGYYLEPTPDHLWPGEREEIARAAREETVLDIRLKFAQRDALEVLDEIGRAQGEARTAGRTELSDRLLDLWHQQNHVTAELIRIINGEGPVEIE